MSSNTPVFLKLLAASVSVVSRAGNIVREVLKKGELGIIEKGKNDLQTEADRSAQRCIIASLSKQFPNVKIIGEEGNSNLQNVPSDWIVGEGDENVLAQQCPTSMESIKEESIVVWVDPLDGTSEYTQGFLEHVTVLIGISINQEPIGGVIHQPFYGSQHNCPGRTIWGASGLGVFGIKLSQPPKRLIINTTRSHSTPLVESALKALEPYEILRVGGAGYKVLQLLEGKSSLYMFASAGCKKWDTCAPEAILNAAGGILTDMNGRKYKYGADVEYLNSGGVLASLDKSLHESALGILPQKLKSKLSA